MRAIRKAVIPAAGLGTRFLPVTKTVPKELLPIIDRPTIDYVVREAAAAGLDDVLLVSGRGRVAILDYFDRAVELEEFLRDRGDEERLKSITSMNGLAKVHSVRQQRVLGLGHAVSVSEPHVGNQPFAVMLGDDIIDPHDPVLDRMIELRDRFGGSVVCLMEVPPEAISLYGAAACRATEDNDIVEVTNLVEKPRADQAPSNLAVIGRYILDPAVFDVLRDTAPDRDGEIQLTDALRTLADVPHDRGGGVRGVIFRGRRYDTGNRESYLRTVVSLALDDPALGKEFGQWLGAVLRERGLVAGEA